QPDNAARVLALGAGDRVMPGKFTGKRVAALDRLLNSSQVKESCGRAAKRCAQQDAIGETVELIERVTQGRIRRSGIAPPPLKRWGTHRERRGFEYNEDDVLGVASNRSAPWLVR